MYIGVILNKILGMRKLSAQWMPHLLTLDNKCNREINLLLCLKLFKQSEGDFTSSSDRRNVDALVCTRDVGVGETMDLPGELLEKKKKTALSARKAMAAVFCDCDFWNCVIYIAYLRKT